MTFAALQLRVNTAVAAKLFDSATLNSVAISGKFDNGNASVLSMLGGNNPTFKCLETSLSGDPRGQTMVINTVSYIVRENKTDGNGMTTLELDKQ